ncbi:MAG: aldolase/citrate lyase family protein [Cellvibrionales bacterium]|nr:aldolase/citrate lyase family protein [Cellvibrionales bacterium]
MIPNEMTLKELIAQKTVLSTFVKTPHPHIIEVLSHCRLDCLIIDTEHTPHDKSTLDLCLLAAKATQQQALVRIADHSSAAIQNALDCGANGILVPHVQTPEQAQSIIERSYYGSTGRGFALATRAGGYGSARSIADHLEQENQNTCILAQIEDRLGLNNVDAIAALPQIDGLFIGQVDLAVSLGQRALGSSVVREAITKIIHAGKRFNKSIGIFLPSSDDINYWQKQGCSLFAIGSEHKQIVQGFKMLVDEYGAQSNPNIPQVS